MEEDRRNEGGKETSQRVCEVKGKEADVVMSHLELVRDGGER